MNDLLKTALIGTAQSPPQLVETAPPVDVLLAGVPVDSPEQELLLRAGVQAIYRQAGFMPEQVPALDPAPQEAGIPPSEVLQTWLTQVLSPEAINLLPEFVRLLAAAGIHFPHPLLPLVLDFTSPERRDLLRPVLGQRARWMAQFNSAWSWVNAEDEPVEQTVSRLRDAWEEGTFPERIDALRRMREIAPAFGRQWLEEVFGAEKADQRRRMLETFTTGLSDEDEPLLARAYEDRSEKVREVATNLLVRLENSQLSRRMQARAAELLAIDLGGRLVCRPPSQLPRDWGRDGIQEKPPDGRGARAWWIEQLVAAVTPAMWQTLLQRTPDELIEALNGDDYAPAVRDGWVAAVARFSDRPSVAAEWGRPLWSWVVQDLRTQRSQPERRIESLQLLARAMPVDQLEPAVEELIRCISDGDGFPVLEFLQILPAPWSTSFSEFYLQLVRRQFQQGNEASMLRWCESLLPAALGLASECIEAALEPWALRPDAAHARSSERIRLQLMRFGEVLRLRQAFRAEVSRIRNAHLP